MYREDCFANTGNDCIALKEKQCYTCKFYKNDLKREDIENEIKKYLLNKGESKNDYK